MPGMVRIYQEYVLDWCVFSPKMVCQRNRFEDFVSFVEIQSRLNDEWHFL